MGNKRNLYLSNVPVEEALERFRSALPQFLLRENESIDVVDSLGRITGESVYALRNSPLYDSAAMDGVAVISARTCGASEKVAVTLKRDTNFAVVDTGDPIRPPYDAVIMAEDIQEIDGDTIVIRSAAAPWQHVRPVGEDIIQGEMILPGSHNIRPIDIGVLLSGGITRIAVRKRPDVAIIPTGTELVEPGDEIKQGNIIESNSRMFEALITQSGGTPHRFPTIPDDYAVIMAEIKNKVATHDMLLVCSGTSAGTEDHTVNVLRELGDVIVHGVAMKPGKPVILAVVNGKPVIGIPGYPVSAYLAFENFSAPILADMTGVPVEKHPTVKATLTRRLVSSLKHREYVRVIVGRVGNRLVASPLARGAGSAMSLVRADGFCVIDQDVEGLEAGAEVDVELSRSFSEADRTIVSIGSHDLILDVISDLLPDHFPGFRLSGAHVGSMGGLMALKNKEAHIAPTHLLSELTGEYNVPILKELFANRTIALIKGVGRTQGIMVKNGNPFGITGIGDLPRCRYINRQRGAGTRVLLDYLLKAAGIDPGTISGYDREAATHMAVAAAVRDANADAGMGVLSAANAMGLDFIPVGDEEYDFAVPVEYLETPHIQAFISILKSPVFLRKLDELGGYTATRCGEIVFI